MLEAFPELKPFFAEMDVTEAGRDLMEFLHPILDSLARPEALNEALQALVEYHVDLGIRPEHHPLIGDTLRQMVAEYLDIDWTEEFEATWIAQYNAVIGAPSAYLHCLPPIPPHPKFRADGRATLGPFHSILRTPFCSTRFHRQHPTVSTSLPKNFTASIASCALAASSSGYVWWIIPLIVPLPASSTIWRRSSFRPMNTPNTVW